MLGNNSANAGIGITVLGAALMIGAVVFPFLENMGQGAVVEGNQSDQKIVM